MTDTQEQRLAEIERRIAAVEEPHGLMRFIDEHADLAAAPGETGVRYAAARGIVLNRTGLPGAARLELQKARDKAEHEGAGALLSSISREIARIHVWRGETTSAALELLRSLVEADATGSRADIEVDGGVDLTNAGELVKAGATILVAGVSIFGTPDPAAATHALRRAAGSRSSTYPPSWRRWQRSASASTSSGSMC